MNPISQQQLKHNQYRQTRYIVNAYIDELNQDLIAKFEYKQKVGYTQHQCDLQISQKNPETKNQLTAIRDMHKRNSGIFGKVQKQQKIQGIRQLCQNEKQPNYYADFETYHQLQGEQDRRIQNAEDASHNYQYNDVARKQSAICQQTYEKIANNIDKAKKNIRVYNKSSTNIHKHSQAKQFTYNELRDKTLVQYFYPRQRKLFGQNVNKIDNLQRMQTKYSKLVKKYASEKNQNMAFFIKKRKQSSYKTKKECGRKTAFNSYDLISCNLSMNHFRIDRHQNPIKNHKTEKDQDEPDENVLQYRIKNMEEKVYKKMPFLVQMGVKFKTARLNC